METECSSDDFNIRQVYSECPITSMKVATLM